MSARQSRPECAGAAPADDGLNLADLSFTSSPSIEALANEHLGAPLRRSRRSQDTPYFYNLHQGDVGHADLGNTGSGKSFLAGFLLMHSQQPTRSPS